MARLTLLILALVAVVLVEARSWSSLEQNGGKVHNVRLPLYMKLRESDGLPDYYTEMAIGTPPQKLKVKVDTTGFDFWVISSKCTKDECKNHTQYDSSKSSSYTKDGRNSSSRAFGMSGFLSRDTLQIGSLTIGNVLFGEATAPGADFKDSAYDAVMGVNFLRPKKGEADNVMSRLAVSGQLYEPRVFFHVDYHVKEDGHAGEIGFGTPDPKDVYGWDVGFSASEDGHSVQNIEVLVGSVTGICNSCNFTIDNNANELTIPLAQAVKLNEALGATKDANLTKKGYHSWSFADCNDDSHPSVHLDFVGPKYYVEPRVYMVKTADGKCKSIFEGKENSDSWQINYQFMKSICISFKTIGKFVYFGQKTPLLSNF